MSNGDEIAPLLSEAVANEADDPATAVLGADAAGIARAADYLSRTYVLVATNVPYLGRQFMSEFLRAFCDQRHALASADLATVFGERIGDLLQEGCTSALVLPQNWLFLSSYRAFRREMLRSREWLVCARLGPGAFEEITGEVVQAILVVLTHRRPRSSQVVHMIDALADVTASHKANALRQNPTISITQSAHVTNPDSIVAFSVLGSGPLLSERAESLQGFITGDNARFRRQFWELDLLEEGGWNRIQTPVNITQPYGGRSE